MQLKKLKIFLAALLLLSSILAGCKPNTGGITIEDAWGRAAPDSVANGAFYMKIKNSTSQADRLVSASSPACISVEVHATTMTGDMASMHAMPEGGLEIPAGETVELETGGIHLMCVEKKEDFSPGKTIPVTLHFDLAGDISVDVEIRNP